METTNNQNNYYFNALRPPIEKQKDFDEYVSKYTRIFDLDENGRYKSYEHIRSIFLKYKDENTEESTELISLHLYAYLASCGMLKYSFLAYKDYLFLKPIVRILCDPKYESLLNFNPYDEDYTIINVNKLLHLIGRIKNVYNRIKYYKDNKEYIIINLNFTDTLISKIISGTYGCMIGYDKNVKNALSEIHCRVTLGRTSIKEMIYFANLHKEEINNQLKKLNNLYTPMKVIDMYLFEKGLHE